MKIDGFLPVIINVAPVNLKLLLGLNTTEDAPVTPLKDKDAQPTSPQPARENKTNRIEKYSFL